MPDLLHTRSPPAVPPLPWWPRVILALAGFAIWAARTTYRAVDDVQRLTLISDAYQDARHAVAQENLAARRYQLRTDPRSRPEFDQAPTPRSNESLTTVRGWASPTTCGWPPTDRGPEPARRRLVREAAGAGSRYRYRSVVDAISDDQLQPAFDSMTAQLDRSGARHRAAALASLHESQRSEQVVLAATAITIALGILLLTSAAIHAALPRPAGAGRGSARWSG